MRFGSGEKKVPIATDRWKPSGKDPTGAPERLKSRTVPQLTNLVIR